jgi:amino acid transporter
MAIVAILGVLRVDLNATVLAVLLILEITAVALFDLGAFMHPADGTITLAGLRPGDLFGGTGFQNIGIVIAFGVAAFTGFESAAIYSEECKDPRHTVGRATFAAVTFISLFYALSAWALTIGTGPSMVAEQSRQNGPGVVFGLFGQYWGNLVADVANVSSAPIVHLAQHARGGWHRAAHGRLIHGRAGLLPPAPRRRQHMATAGRTDPGHDHSLGDVRPHRLELRHPDRV